MSKPHYRWWGYALQVTKHYGDGTNSNREETAVADAIEETTRGDNGADRVMLVALSTWRRTHTIEGAAMVVHVSFRTAQRWRADFIKLVGKYLGL